MRIFVVRVNPDNSVIQFDSTDSPINLTACYQHSDVDNKKSYEALERKTLTTQNGFHECQNFLAVNGKIQGYLPPKSLRGVPEGEHFSVIFITNKGCGLIQRGGKTTKKNVSNSDKRFYSNKVVGIQVNCKYLGGIEYLKYSKEQWGGEDPLIYKYTCSAKNSFLFKESLDDAAETLLGPDLGKSWGSALGPSQEILVDNVYFRDFLNSHKNIIDENIYKELSNELGEAELSPEEELVDCSANKVSSEGRRFLSTHKSIERNQTLVKRAKTDYKKACAGCAPCELCGLDFNKVYKMPQGEFYIEAHHIHPLADNDGASIQTDPKNDFAFLCSNCHRMVHRHLAKLSKDERARETSAKKKDLLKSYKQNLLK